MMQSTTPSHAKSATAREHFGAIGLLVLIGIVALLALYIQQGKLTHPFNSTSDATIYAQVGFKLNDPSLYPNDVVISSMARDLFTVLYYAMLPDTWESLEHVETTYVVLSFVFGLIFSVGVYLLIYEIFRRRDIALGVALLCLLIRRSLMETPCGWGTRIISPRFVVFGLAPVLMWLYWRWRRTWKSVAIFAAFGVLLAMHPRFPAYPVAFMVLDLLIQERPSVRHWTRIAACVSAFLPFMLGGLWLAFSRLGAGGVSGEGGVSVRLGTYDFPGGCLRELFFSGLDATVPLALGTLGWLRKRKKEGVQADEREALLVFDVIPVALYVVLWLAVMLIPALQTAKPHRFLTYVFLIPYAFGVYWIVDQWRRGKLRHRLIALLTAATLFAATEPVIMSLLEDNPFYHQLVDRVYEETAAEKMQEQRDVVLARASQAEPIEEDWESFHALCDWARTSTPLDAVFVIPPRNFSLFRLYSQRSLYTSAKNVGGFGARYASAGDLLWEKYEAATAAYDSGVLDDFQSLQVLDRADYVVIEQGRLKLDASPVYVNRRYAVYALLDIP